MALNVKASKEFKKLPKAEKPPFGTNVINGLDNSVFSDPPIPISELQTINTNLTNVFANALTGNHVAIAAVKPAVTAWNNAFGRTADYVSTVAEGDESIIRMAGYTPTKSERTPSQKPGAINNFIATINGTKGGINTGSKDAVPGGDAYFFFAAPEGAVITYSGDTTIITMGENSIYVKASKSRQTEIHDMPSGVSYNVGMYAINTAGSGPAADIKQVIPQ